MEIKEILKDDSRYKLYQITKEIIEEKKEREDITIKQCMQHDSYKRVNRRIKQKGWGK